MVKRLFEYIDGNLYWRYRPPEHFARVQAYKMWNKRYAGTRAGWRGNRYKKVSIGKRSYSIHRLIYLYHKGYIPKELDHIDGNRNNNRIENLRAASKYQNKWNSRKHKDNKSGIKSVFKRGKVYEVCIFARHKRYYVGRFKTKKDAVIAVTRAREEIHGRFARVN